jgi:hypothetical protein
MTDYSKRAKKGWARRRLRAYLKRIKSWLGHTPAAVTVWADDYDLLDGESSEIELRRGPPKSPCESQKMRVHR